MVVHVDHKLKIGVGFFVIFLVIPMIYAGVGIKWDRQSMLIPEGERGCLSYSVYNPWPKETNVVIDVSDELKPVLVLQEAETKFVPAYTYSNQSIPIKFCFKAPFVFPKDCLIAGFICKKVCTENFREFRGEVIVSSVPGTSPTGGSGGSATRMAVGAPLVLRVQCIAHPRNFILVYILIGLIAALIIGGLLYKKYRKSPLERDKDKLRALKDKIKRESKKKK